jgi:hypothetical protein
VAARRAKRENGGLGEDPPGGTIILLSLPIASLAISISLHSRGGIRRARAKRDQGGLGGDPQKSSTYSLLLPSPAVALRRFEQSETTGVWGVTRPRKAQFTAYSSSRELYQVVRGARSLGY